MNDTRPLLEVQQSICREFGVSAVQVASTDKLGIAENVRTGLLPINGVRIPPEGGTCGWYIWAGESMSKHDEFFKPLHVAHLAEWCPSALPFLLLPPGWHFLVAGDYRDVWFSPATLNIG